MKTYLFSYEYKGLQYGFEIKADSLHEAKKRRNCMASSAYDGELVAKIPTVFGWLARAIVWLKSL